MDVSALKLKMPLKESTFPFSKRMLHFFEELGLRTVEDVCKIPLQKLTCFRGFKTKCTQELIAFIEFEEIGFLFEGFKQWKETNS